MTTDNTVLARIAALKTMPTPELRLQWQQLFDTPPPLYNRRFLESRLAYRIQELAYGGLKPETVRRLERLGEQLDGGNIAVRRVRGSDQPIAGTRLLRQYQGEDLSCRDPACLQRREPGPLRSIMQRRCRRPTTSRPCRGAARERGTRRDPQAWCAAQGTRGCHGHVARSEGRR